MNVVRTLAGLVLFQLCFGMYGNAAVTPDTVRGRVRDQTASPIKGAEIIVADIGRLAITGRTGEFVINAPAGSTLLIRAAGYRSVTRRANGQPLDVTLTATPFGIDPINVTALRVPTSNAGNLSTSVLTREDLSREAGVSLAHELDDLPGVRTLSTGEQIGKPLIRGVYGSRVLVLEDAMRLEDYSWSDEDAPSIDARFADRVEVVRGPASLLYGSDAVGGVINVIPQPVPQAGSRVRRSGFEASTSTNQHESAIIARTEGASAALGWRGLLVGRFAQNLNTPAGPINNTGFAVVNGELAAGTQRPWGSLTLRLVQYGGEFKLLETDALEAGAADKGGPVRKLADERAQLVGAFPIGKARLETRVQFQRHWLQEVADAPATAVQSKAEVPVFELLLNTLTLDVLAHHALRGTVHGSVGAAYESQHNDSRGILPVVPDAVITNAAVFVVERLSTGLTEWTAGARIDHHTVDPTATRGLAVGTGRSAKNAASLNLGVGTRVAPQLRLRANAGTAWRAPNLFELYASGPRIGEARYEIGNSGLEPEKAFELDVGANFETSLLGVDLSLYDNRFANFIALQPTSELRDGLRAFTHEAVKARMRGVEASADIRPAESLRIFAAYDAVHANNEDRDLALPWIPAPRFHGYVEIAGKAGSLEQAYARATLERVSKKTRVAANEPTSDAYTLVGLAAGGKTNICSHPTRIDAAVKNGTNTAYRDFLNRYRDFALNPGRDVTLRISIDL